jgi:acyl transferase domain-containing protein
MARHGFHDTPLAIVGMACRLPGADSLDDYWGLVRQGRCALAELPPDRFDQELYYTPDRAPGRSYSKIGGVVRGRPSDGEGFPADLLASADPAHRIMLQVVAEALRHAGWTADTWSGRDAGVFIGHARGSLLAGDLVYTTHIEELTHTLAHSAAGFARLPATVRDGVVRALVDDVRRRLPHREPGGAPFVGAGDVAALVAEALGVTGPHMVVDAACASSLYALAMAAAALHDGRIDMAVVGGASFSSWQSQVVFSGAQALSADGSRPFDERADGFVSSDGYAVVLVETLARALADGHKIYGVVRGIGLSNDGRGRSLWAPRREGQVQAIRRAYGPGVHPGRLQYIEAHGTSTQLGDATEIEALTTALAGSLPAGARIPIGSSKGNVGHTRETAGLAGLIKTLLSMHHGIVPPAANFEVPNSQIRWDDIPFSVPTREIEWPAGEDGLRHAAVDAFGIGGMNVHVVLEAAPSGGAAAVVLPAAPGVAGDGRDVGQPGDTDAIAVVGMSAILPGAHTLAAYRDLLGSGRRAIVPVPPDRWAAEIFHDPGLAQPWRSPVALGGFLTGYAYDWRRHKIPPKQVETGDLLQYIVLDAANQALEGAGYLQKAFDRSRVAVVVGTVFGGDFNIHLNVALRLPEYERDLRRVLQQHGVPDDQGQEIVAQCREALLRRWPMLQDETGGYSSSTLASRVAKTFDFQGGAFAVDAGEASSLAALDVAADLLRSGACDLAVCAGAQRAMDISVYEGMAMRGMLAAAAPDAGGDDHALVPGEGVALVLLKRLGDARRDGDAIHAIIRGIGAAFVPGSRGDGLRDATLGALARCGCAADTVRVVDDPLMPGSVASQIGYAFGASGMASLVRVILTLQQDDRHAHEGMTGRRIGAVSNVAFRGLAYHVVVETDPAGPRATPKDPDDWRIIRLGASTGADLSRLLGDGVGRAHVLYGRAAETRYETGDHARLAIVASNAGTLGKKLGLAAAQLTDPAARPVLEEQGIFWREELRRPPRVALLFPGQGSQYVGMLRELIRESAAAGAMLDEVDEAMQRLGLQTFAEIAWSEDAPLGQDVWLTQVSVLLADVIVYAALRALGIRPDVVAGHSYGEYPALVAAGAWSLETAIRLTRARCGFIEASPRSSGVLLSTTAPPEVVRRLIAGISGTLAIANYNAPDQTVVGGEGDAVGQIGSLLVAEGFDAQVLPVPRAFHTPLMAEVEGPLRAALQETRIMPPAIPLLSSVTNRYVADPADIRDALIQQLTEPVRFKDLIERLARDETTIFVEAGPRQVLTRLGRRILTDGDAIQIAADNPRRPGRSQLLHVQAALEVAGVTVGDRQARGLAVDRPVALTSAQAGAPIVFFDATRRRREKMRSRAEATTPADVEPVPAAAGPEAAQDALTAFLIDFVCEQTGYPREVVDLDADMEADLGIDSIKKAQLFGELRERFNLQVKADGRLSLDDFPTLRHVLEFLRRAGVTHGPVAARPDAEQRDESEVLPEVVAPSDAPAPQVVQTDGETAPVPVWLTLARFHGRPDEMGAQQGRAWGPEIRRTLEELQELFRRRPLDEGGPALREFLLRMPQDEGGQALLLEALLREADRYFDTDTLDELRGLSAALDVPLSHLIAFNVAVDRAYAAGCAHFAVSAGRNSPSGMIHGTNEDCPIALLLPGALSRVVQARHPSDGIPHLLFGVAGLVGGLNGMNAQGLVVTSALLLDRLDSHDHDRQGTIHPVLVRAMLQHAADIDGAIDILRRAPRSGAWSLCISHHPTDRLAFVEYDADSLEVRLDWDKAMGTNHCLVHNPRQAAPQHSLNRLRRLQGLLGNGQAGFTLAQAQAALQDRYDVDRQRHTPHPTMNTVQRVDNQISLVMRPAVGEAWVAHGPRAGTGQDGEYHRLDVRRLLASGRVPAHVAAGPSSTAVADRHVAPAADEPAREAPTRHTMGRFVLRMAEAPLPAGAPGQPGFHGPVLILGENATARVLADRLAGTGVPVSCLPAGDDLGATLAAFDRAWSAHPIAHLFVLTARDEDAGAGFEADAWMRRRRRGVAIPYFVCQRWMSRVAEARLLETASLAAVTSLGGDFGFAGNVSVVEGGGLAGLLKAIHRESKIAIKVIDTLPEESPEAVVTAVWAELAAATAEVEVGYVRGRRSLVRAVPRPVSPNTPRAIPRGGTWVVTGGARGATAVVARELGRRFGLNLHLIGTQPAPAEDGPGRHDGDAQTAKARVMNEARAAGRDPVAAWDAARKAQEIRRTLQALAGDGVRATYHACDVSDRRAVGAVLERIRASDGPIHGIIHGAGVELAARFERKQPERVEATLAAKVDGAAALLALTQDDPLAYFIAFGSISGRFGGLGQTDYSMASDLLAKLVQGVRAGRPECAAVAFHWPAWDEVGMAMRPESRFALEVGQQQFMPPLEGVAHLVAELEAGAPEGEVLIVDRPGLLDTDGTMPAAEEAAVYSRVQVELAGRPLIDGVRELAGSSGLVAEIRLDPVADPFLRQHRLHGRPILPAVVGLEALAEAASLLDGRPVTALRRVEIAHSLRFYHDRPQRVDVRVTLRGTGADAVLSAPFYSRQGRLVDPRRTHVTGLVEFAGDPLVGQPLRAPHPEVVWYPVTYPDAGPVGDEAFLFHGPVLRCLVAVAGEAGGGWARVVAAPLEELGGERGQGWIIPAACLDACLLACGLFTRQVYGIRQLPQRFASLRLGRQPRPQETCMLQFDYHGRAEQHTSFDFTLYGEDGDPILSVEDYGGVILHRQ